MIPVPILGSKGHCLYIQGEEVSNADHSLVVIFPKLNVQQNSVMFNIYDQKQHIDPKKIQKSQIHTRHTQTYACMYV